MISWGGARCGADHLPSVAAEVARYRDFVLAPDPVWEPQPTSPVLISGDTRVGGTLTCTSPAFDAPVDAVTIQWRDHDYAVVATGPSYTVQARDAGRDIACAVIAGTAGVAPGGLDPRDQPVVYEDAGAGRLTATIPAVPGTISTGWTKAEARRDVVDALRTMLSVPPDDVPLDTKAERVRLTVELRREREIGLDR